MNTKITVVIISMYSWKYFLQVVCMLIDSIHTSSCLTHNIIKIATEIDNNIKLIIVNILLLNS